jgi:L-threonylcarbamoyladenylate synthase
MVIFRSINDPALVAMIRRGAVGILPTDTLYGVVASAQHPAAATRLYELKRRERKPGTTVAANVEQLEALGIDSQQLARITHLWPNPLSVILPHKLTHIHQGRGDSPFRIVADSHLQKLLAQTGPLVTSSANHPGEQPATNLAAAQTYFGDSVDFYVDGGDLGERPPSTIIRLEDNGDITIIREGAITLNKQGKII